MPEHPDLSDPAYPARARRAINAQLLMNAEAEAATGAPRRMETLFSGPMVAAPPPPAEHGDEPWRLSRRTVRRLYQAGDDVVSGDSPYTQHHSLDWLASNPFGIPTNWAFNDRRRSATVALISLVVVGLALAVALAVATLANPIAQGDTPVPTPVPTTTPAGAWCDGCAPAS